MMPACLTFRKCIQVTLIRTIATIPLGPGITVGLLGGYRHASTAKVVG